MPNLNVPDLCVQCCDAQAAGLALGLLVVGALLGTGVEAWLRVDIVPLGVSKRARFCSAPLNPAAQSLQLPQLLLQLCTPAAVACAQSFGSPGVLITEFIIAALAAGTVLLV
jgi:hypothetical protein